MANRARIKEKMWISFSDVSDPNSPLLKQMYFAIKA